mgnify:CR=1 FL=1
MKILQLGKFHPVRGGVEKVMYDLMTGLSERGVDCDMLCALSQGGSRTIPVNAHARLIGCRTWAKVAATMISPAMIFSLRKRCGEYDIIHVHHPDPMACLALFLSGYRGKVVLHWHSDIEKQKTLLRLYRPLQEWLLGRADLIVGTTPVYTAESPCLVRVRHKTACLPIGVDPVVPAEGAKPDITLPDGEQIMDICTNAVPSTSSAVVDDDQLLIATYNPTATGRKPGSLYVYSLKTMEKVKEYVGICEKPVAVAYKFPTSN